MFYGRLTFCRKTARMYAKPGEQLLTADNLSKPGSGWAASRRLIPTGERSGMETRIAPTESILLCLQMKS
jgi:hypothetical protein